MSRRYAPAAAQTGSGEAQAPGALRSAKGEAGAAHIFVVAAPSGAGKSSLVNALLRQDESIRLSVSFTTRAPRPGETHGREYHFVSREEFAAGQARGDFLEAAEVHGNWYGTSRPWLERQLKDGHDVLLEIDWQGAQQVRRQLPQSVGIFILPPSLEALRARLDQRGQDASDVIERRVQAARGEMAHAPEFDFVIINEVFERALGELIAIVTATRLRTESQLARHDGLLRQLSVLGGPANTP
jgi:guanylate kinase